MNTEHEIMTFEVNGLIYKIVIVEAFSLSFCSGNAIKYILRAGAKLDYEGQNPKEKMIEDYQKVFSILLSYG